MTTLTQELLDCLKEAVRVIEETTHCSKELRERLLSPWKAAISRAASEPSLEDLLAKVPEDRWWKLYDKDFAGRNFFVVFNTDGSGEYYEGEGPTPAAAIRNALEKMDQ